MLSIVTGSRFIDGESIAHFIVVDTILRGNYRRPTAVSIVIKLSDGIKFFRSDDVLHGENNLFGPLSGHGEEIRIIRVQTVLPQVDNGLCRFLGRFIVAPVERSTHLDGQCGSLGNSSACSGLGIDVCNGLVEIFEDLCFHLFYGVAGHLRFCRRIKIADDGDASVKSTQRKILISAYRFDLCHEIFLDGFIAERHLIYIQKKLVAASNDREIVERPARIRR